MPPIALWDHSWDRSLLCSQVLEISTTAADTPSGGASLQSAIFSAAAEGMVTLDPAVLWAYQEAWFPIGIQTRKGCSREVRNACRTNIAIHVPSM
jgi:hypothetical protein